MGRSYRAPDNRKVKARFTGLSLTARFPLKSGFTTICSLLSGQWKCRWAGHLPILSPNSLEVIPNAFAEPSLAAATPLDRYQFERLGYFVRDLDTSDGKPVFNKTVGLRDTWLKVKDKPQ